MFRTRIKTSNEYKAYIINCPICRNEDVLWTRTPKICWMCGHEYKFDMFSIVEDNKKRLRHHILGREGIPNGEDDNTKFVSGDFQT